MLNACGQRTIACGNIGKPLSEVAREKNQFDVLTVEVSSFQLETIQTFRPSISLWLNFAPDHLDRYRSVADYRAAKLRIFENQTVEDVAVINAIETLPAIHARTITFSAYVDQADLRLSEGVIVYENKAALRLSDTKLRGLHNIENLMATLAVGMARGLSFRQMVPPLCAYEPRPHRCEFVREVGGVMYVNDSKATNLDAVEDALRATFASARSIQIPTLLKRADVGAPTARRSFGALAEIDYDQLSEPTMTMSRAFLIALLLHVVALSGSIAFNARKTRQPSPTA